MNIIATIIDTHTAFVVITDGVNSAQDFTLNSGAPFTFASLAVAANDIAAHLFGFTAELAVVHGSDGSALVGGNA